LCGRAIILQILLNLVWKRKAHGIFPARAEVRMLSLGAHRR